MPEGPEVATNVDFMKQYLNGNRISCIEIVSGRYKKHGPFSGYEKFKTNMLVDRVSCKGKFIFVLFEDTSSLWSTLGMTGIWQNRETKHTRVILRINTGECLYYNDIRNFGTLKYNTDPYLLSKKLDSLGMDFLKQNYKVTRLVDNFMKKKKKTIAEVLMDQSICAGIGNYLKAEILYDAAISPHRLIESLDSEEFTRLCAACHKIPRVSYHKGGATIYTYKTGDGKDGMYTSRFMVYNRKRDSLGNPVIKETTKDKRTTHWVPNIQK